MGTGMQDQEATRIRRETEVQCANNTTNYQLTKFV